MNYSQEESPLLQTTLTKDKMERWVEAQLRGEPAGTDVYGAPSAQQLRDLEHVRTLSKELQSNLHELEASTRVPEVENEAMNPTASILDYSEDHEFVPSNQYDTYYAEEDKLDAKEEERRKLTKDGRISLKASRVVEKVML